MISRITRYFIFAITLCALGVKDLRADVIFYNKSSTPISVWKKLNAGSFSLVGQAAAGASVRHNGTGGTWVYAFSTKADESLDNIWGACTMRGTQSTGNPVKPALDGSYAQIYWSKTGSWGFDPNYGGYLYLSTSSGTVTHTATIDAVVTAGANYDLGATTAMATTCGGSGGTCQGMARYFFHKLACSISIKDTPLFYTPPVGPSMDFTITYNQKEAFQPTNFVFSNLGQHWNFSYISYIADTPTNKTTVRVFVRGGGSEVCSGYNSNTLTYARHLSSGTVVQALSDSSYLRTFRDGSSELYDYVQSNNPDRRIFLTQSSDTSGNTIHYDYETLTNGSVRLAYVVDAIGQTNHLTYGQQDDQLKITAITDPFGRSALIQYELTNSELRLVQITDTAALASQFRYGINGTINALVTPYGTTTFTYQETNGLRFVSATDPMGQTECLQFRSVVSNVVAVAPPNLYWDFAGVNNSLFWNKKAWATTPNDTATAEITHWAALNGQLVDIPLFIKPPLENGIWFNYQGQTNGSGAGLRLADPIIVARVLDNGSTKNQSFSYDSFGNITNAVDAIGRTTRFIYSTNGIDLLQVSQKNSSGNDVLGSFVYNDQHLPIQTVMAGITNWFSYSTNGLLLANTNTIGQVSTYTYDVNGFLTKITGHVPEDTVDIAYDAAGRVNSLTDSQGYTITSAYDNLNRLTNTALPDGSSIRKVYDKLDVARIKGRDNRWTYQTHDANRKLTDVQDQAGHIYHYEWCGCGALESITDPKGQMTIWTRDLQNRPTQKLYADLAGDSIAYETTTSRVKSTTDAAGKKVSLAYANDDNVTNISYSGGPTTPGVSFTYDTNYNRMTKMLDGIGTNALTYVPAGQPAAGSVQTLDGPLANDTITVGYDALGRPLTLQIGSASSSVQYDTIGRIWWSSNMLGVTTVEYLGATSRPDKITRPNGLTSVFGYTPITDGSRLQSMVTTNGAGLVVESYGYSYDIRNLIMTQTNVTDGITTVWSYDYDLAQQLTSATKATNGTVASRYSYTYDKAGNRMTEQVNTSAATEQANNLNQVLERTGGGQIQVAGFLNETGSVAIAGSPARMTSPTDFTGTLNVGVGTNTFAVSAVDPSGNAVTNWYDLTVSANGLATSFAYDKAGDLLVKSNASQVMRFGWDGADRCTAITNGTLRTAVAYDGLNRWSRIQEFSGTNLTADRRFVWNGTTLAEERGATGTNVVKRYFSGGFWQAGTNYYYLTDHLGSVVGVTLQDGTVVARFEYDPYGQRTQTFGTLQVDYGFAGLFEHSNGLKFAVWRIYDPATGRWLSRDPIREDGGWNLYAYCGGNPVTRVDSDGTTWVVSSQSFPGAQSSGVGPYVRFIDDGSTLVKPLRTLNTRQMNAELNRLLGVLKNKKHRLLLDLWDERSFDSQFFEGKCANDREYYSYNGEVFADNELNYIGIGMYEAWLGSDKLEMTAVIRAWKSRYVAGALLHLDFKGAAKETDIVNPLTWAVIGHDFYTGHTK